MLAETEHHPLTDPHLSQLRQLHLSHQRCHPVIRSFPSLLANFLKILFVCFYDFFLIHVGACEKCQSAENALQLLLPSGIMSRWAVR